MKKKLTKREKEVLKLISEGLTSEEIAKIIGVTQRTVDAHRANAMQRTGAKNSAHLVAMWYQEMMANGEWEYRVVPYTVTDMKETNGQVPELKHIERDGLTYDVSKIGLCTNQPNPTRDK